MRLVSDWLRPRLLASDWSTTLIVARGQQQTIHLHISSYRSTITNPPGRLLLYGQIEIYNAKKT